MEEKKITIGGQAVIEGVMMRGPELVATAVRNPQGRIELEVKPVNSIADRYPIFKKPMLRGCVSLFESLVMGIRSLGYSAQMAGEEDEQLTDKELAGTMIFAFALAAVLFIAIPTGAAKLFHVITEDPVFLNLMEGFLRLFIFMAYIFAISRMKDIQRVFQYHGAEHKTIACFEAGEALTVENVARHTRLHKRCGTSFLLIVMLVSIFVFAFLGWPDLAERIASRIILLPVVAGISYEIIRFSANSDNCLLGWAVKPGLWLQKLTTREPEPEMIEVAIESAKAVLPEDKIPAGTGSYR
ncbi:DUF1385 domain-containing protein [Veillonellaceae bacterium WCA-693-APC-5D-A]|uniref:DUF1385 domain-containing protein n=1 Tax=Anaerovibrio slackiae TaxID=2652309 RepID=A0A6I2UIR4_9FIRM|nr:DUF1385 domain-containing protein [Anaerovibrio slackiae]MBQ2011037.1 DUF1385 domain-containing protein [Selenomonadaceae bacterium]MBQ2410273.1 DUF1385 domain-containing protein [Selenomonadaceae bacterium]MBQ5651273.1 DUF1385 domain-containing protein [Selenomonadaceae bacterium]MBQ5733257.1 DUF1385 domain-containing protein [Selenomonadaceae bacterium]MBQ5823002.1 DUF1385 domain-containing protein [Selenomonadaceae bacterium]